MAPAARRSSTPVRSGPRPAVAAVRATKWTVSSGRKLAELPALGADHGGGTDEPAQAGPVGSQQDGQVAGEVHRTDRVGRVVDVGRVQAGIAPVGPAPGRSGADQADPGAGRVEMHVPPGGIERGQVVVGEELRCGVRPGDDLDLPLVHEDGECVHPLDATRWWDLPARSRAQHVAGAQDPPTQATQPTEGEGGGAAQVLGQVQPPGHQEVGPDAGRPDGADVEHGASRDEHRLPHGDGCAVQGDLAGRTGDADPGVDTERDGRALQRGLQAGCVRRVAEHPVAPAKRAVVHGARGGNPDRPEVLAARPGLHGGLDTRSLDVEPGRAEPEAGERRSGMGGRREVRRCRWPRPRRPGWSQSPR